MERREGRRADRRVTIMFNWSLLSLFCLYFKAVLKVLHIRIFSQSLFWRFGEVANKKKGSKRVKNRKLLDLFFRVLKDVGWREGGDTLSLLQSDTHLISPFHKKHMRSGFSHADPDFILFGSLEDQATTQRQGEKKMKRCPRLSFYIYSPAMHRYMIYSASSNNLSLYFCQCTVLLKPVYIQPHDDAWLLTL